MAGNLKDKVAIVTGVSHDGQVGQAVAKALAAQGRFTRHLRTQQG